MRIYVWIRREKCGSWWAIVSYPVSRDPPPSCVRVSGVSWPRERYVTKAYVRYLNCEITLVPIRYPGMC